MLALGLGGGEAKVALTPAAEASELDSGLLNDHALKTSSIVEPAVPKLAPYAVENQAPGAGRRQDSVAGDVCNCIVCAGVGKKTDSLELPCRVPGCNVPSHNQILFFELSRKEASHFRVPGEYKFKCAENNCTVTVSSMADLRRHYTSKHCTKCEKFPCRFVWCKYSGDNGFKRKDKLTSHYRNSHEGKMGRAKATRVTKPKASESGSGGVGAGASGKKSTPPAVPT